MMTFCYHFAIIYIVLHPQHIKTLQRKVIKTVNQEAKQYIILLSKNAKSRIKIQIQQLHEKPTKPLHSSLVILSSLYLSWQLVVVVMVVVLKTLDTIGICQRLFFTVGISQHMHKIKNLWKFELNWVPVISLCVYTNICIKYQTCKKFGLKWSSNIM